MFVQKRIDKMTRSRLLFAFLIALTTLTFISEAIAADDKNVEDSFITQDNISFKLPDGWKFDKMTERGISIKSDKYPGEIVIFHVNAPDYAALKDSAKVGFFHGFALQTASMPYDISDTLIGMNYFGWDNNQTVEVRSAYSTLFGGTGAAIFAIVGKKEWNKKYEEFVKFIGESIQEHNALMAAKEAEKQKNAAKKE